MTRLRVVSSLVLGLVTAMASQTFGQAPPQAVPPVSAPIALGTRVGASASGYDDGGRRDPFVSLIVPKPTATAKPAPGRGRALAGLTGVSVSDVVVKGLVRSGSTLIALLQGPDGRTYMAKRQDQLLDGVVTRIDADAVVFTERIADASGVVRTREVRKPLRAAASGGEI